MTQSGSLKQSDPFQIPDDDDLLDGAMEGIGITGRKNRRMPVNGNGHSCEPLSSVWDGSDGELLEAIFKFYPTIPVSPILDATYNAGRMWTGSKRKVVSIDIDPQHKPMFLCDNREMPGVKSSQYGASWSTIHRTWDHEALLKVVAGAAFIF